MTKKNLLIFMLILEVVFTGRIAFAQSRKLEFAMVEKQSEDAKVVANFIETFGSRPLKANLVFWRVVRYMNPDDQTFFNRVLDNKIFSEAPVSFERLSANKLAVKVGGNSATIETVSIADGKFRINGKLIQVNKNDSAAEVQAQIRAVLGKKTASMREVIFGLLVQPAFAQLDFSSLLAPLMQIAMMQMQQSAQASADCGTISQASGFCSSVTQSADPQRVSGWGLDNAIQMSTPLVQKSWSQATHDKCGAQLQQLADCVNLAQFEKMYGGWKPCSDPHQQGGGYVAVAYTIPCPATGGQASATGVTANSPNSTAIAGAQIPFRQQVRSDNALTKPTRTLQRSGLR